MTALPIEGYAREYTDASALLADYRARKARLWAKPAPKLVRSPEPAPEPEPIVPPAPADPMAGLLTEYRLFFESVPLGGKQRAKEIIAEVSRERDISVGHILGRSRQRQIARARQFAAWRIAEETTLSLPQIGQILGGRDHSTILHSVRFMNDANKANVRKMGGVR